MGDIPVKENYSYPKFVNVENSFGTIEKMEYKKIIEHEETIIEDNIFYGIKNGCDEKEILEYKKQAIAELKLLKQAICENKDIVLKIDKQTERFVVI